MRKRVHGLAMGTGLLLTGFEISRTLIRNDRSGMVNLRPIQIKGEVMNNLLNFQPEPFETDISFGESYPQDESELNDTEWESEFKRSRKGRARPVRGRSIRPQKLKLKADKSKMGRYKKKSASLVSSNRSRLLQNCRLCPSSLGRLWYVRGRSFLFPGNIPKKPSPTHLAERNSQAMNPAATRRPINRRRNRHRSMCAGRKVA